MKHIFVVLTTVIVLASALAAPIHGQGGGTVSGRYWQRPGSVSVTRGEMVNSSQGRYRQRGSAGDVVAVTTLGAAQVEGSLGFWWRSTETLPGDLEPSPIYLPVVFK